MMDISISSVAGITVPARSPPLVWARPSGRPPIWATGSKVCARGPQSRALPASQVERPNSVSSLGLACQPGLGGLGGSNKWSAANKFLGRTRQLNCAESVFVLYLLSFPPPLSLFCPGRPRTLLVCPALGPIRVAEIGAPRLRVGHAGDGI